MTDHDHVRRVELPAHRSRHLEAVDVRKLDVEQDDIGPQPCDLGQCPRSVPGLAHHDIAGLHEVRPERRAEAGMVIDQQDGAAHRGIMSSGRAAYHRANPWIP